MATCLSETEYSAPLNITKQLISDDNVIINTLKKRQNKFNIESTQRVLNSQVKEEDVELNVNNNEEIIENFSTDIVPMKNSLYGLITVGILLSVCCFLKKF